MATFDAQKTSWTAAEMQHFVRRAGFGLTPEAAATLAVQPLASVVDAWVDGTASLASLESALLKGDVISDPARNLIPADPASHPFHLEGWRRQTGIPNAQAHFAFRMQYSPNPLQEKLALFWSQLFATGAQKVDNTALTVKQINLFRSPTARGPFGDLLVAVSQDPAMLLWLDTVQNKVRPGSADVPNENFAREVLELYSLGVDNGYNQQDITNLARAFSGWTFAPLDVESNPNDGIRRPNDGTFGVDPRYHATGTITFMGQTFDIGASTHNGQDVIAQILAYRGGANCAQFLAKRLLLFFVNPGYTAQALDDLQAVILSEGFHIGNVLKRLFKSAYFYDSAHHYTLYEGPVAWIVRAARMLCPDLPTASSPAFPLYPAWKGIAPSFDNSGQDVLNPDGPNGWKEHDGWINSNTMRYRGKLAAALALGETFNLGQQLFPTVVGSWFPTQPTSPQAIFDRLVALLQPAPIPGTVGDAWLAGLWPGAFLWDASNATQQKVRELAFLLLNSPQAQLH